MSRSFIDRLAAIYEEELPDAELREIIREARDATKETAQYLDVTCKHCGKRQKVRGMARDWKGLETLLKLHDRAVGTPQKAPDPPVPVDTSRPLEELSDDELRRLAAGR